MQIPMKHISLVAFQHDQAKIMAELQKLAAVEVSAIADQGVLAEADRKLEHVIAALRFYKPYDKRKTSMFTSLPQVTKGDLDSSQAKAEHAMAQAAAWEQRLLAITSESQQAESLIAQLEPWKGFPEDLTLAMQSEHVVYLTGFVPKAQVVRLTASENDEYFAAVCYGEQKGQQAVFVAVHRSQLDSAYAVLAELSWSEVHLPKLSGTARMHLEAQHALIQGLNDERAQIAEAASVGDCLSDLEKYYDALSIQSELDAAENKLHQTDCTFFMAGWIRANDENLVRQAIQSVSETYWVDIRDAVEGEAPPTYLENNGLVQPFEQITNLFSPPNPSETDPNTVMGFFYWLLFGMMLSDAGYGLVLGIFAFGAYFLTKPEEGKKSMFWMLGLCSISTVFWGIMFGSYFGEEIIPHVLVSPMNDPITMLILCYSLGFIHLMAGMLMKAYELVKNGQALDAFLDVGMWIFLLVGLIMFVVPPVASIAPYVAGFGALGILFTHGRAESGIVAKLGGGFMSLYGVTSYLADVLSYSRLFALGLTTGVIAMVFNIIGGMIAEISLFGIPIGYPIAAVFLVALHAANLVLNALGAYVHTSRLQFIEFFGKFYSGGGRLFKPLAAKLRYGRLKE